MDQQGGLLKQLEQIERRVGRVLRGFERRVEHSLLLFYRSLDMILDSIYRTLRLMFRTMIRVLWRLVHLMVFGLVCLFIFGFGSEISYISSNKFFSIISLTLWTIGFLGTSLIIFSFLLTIFSTIFQKLFERLFPLEEGIEGNENHNEQMIRRKMHAFISFDIFVIILVAILTILQPSYRFRFWLLSFVQETVELLWKGLLLFVSYLPKWW